MFKVKVDIDGDEALLRKLDGAPRVVRQELKRATAKSLLTIQGDVTDYPPQPEGTGYKRTGLYGKEWLIKTTSVGRRVEGILGTNLSYAPYVRGPKQPEWMKHWEHLVEIIDENLTKVEEFLEEAGRRIAERLRR